MVLIRIILYLVLLHGVLAGYDTEVISLINDLINNLVFPKQILASICWSPADVIRFQKILFRENYFFGTLDTHLDINLHRYSGEYCVFVIDLRCSDSENILVKANELKMLGQMFKWIVIGTPANFKQYNVYVRLDSTFFIIDEISGGTYEISSIYKISRNSSFIEGSIGIWQSNVGFLTYRDLVIPRQRVNLSGMLTYVPYVATTPETKKHLNDYRQNHIDPIAKVGYKIVCHLADYVNMKPQWIERSTWGYRNDTTGLYSGMIGDLQSGLSDIGGTPCFFTEDRIEIVDYIAAPSPTFMRFIFRAPPLSFVANVFTLPFHAQVWKYCLVTVIISAVVTFLIVIWEWKDPSFTCLQDDKPDLLRPNILDVIMVEIGVITQQGADAVPRSNAGRIAIVVSLLVLMFLYTSYSANIVALLQSTSDNIRSLDDMLNSRMKLGVEDIVYAHYYFENAQDPVRKAIYEQKVAPKGQKSNYMTTEEGITKMRDEFFGFHVELSKGYKVVGDLFQEHQKCGLQEIEYVSLLEPWLAIPKNSSYKEIFKAGLRKIHESGLQRREVNRIYTRKPLCHNKGSNFVSVGLIDCYFAFVMFAVGTLLCLLIFMIETSLPRYLHILKTKKADK